MSHKILQRKITILFLAFIFVGSFYNESKACHNNTVKTIQAINNEDGTYSYSLEICISNLIEGSDIYGASDLNLMFDANIISFSPASITGNTGFEHTGNGIGTQTLSYTNSLGNLVTGSSTMPDDNNVCFNIDITLSGTSTLSSTGLLQSCDLNGVLLGTPIIDVNVPTMSQWGLLIFCLLILNMGISFVHRKSLL